MSQAPVRDHGTLPGSDARPLRAPGRDVADLPTFALRYWWAVAILVVLSVAGAALTSLTADPGYTGRATLTVASPERDPSDDAVLVAAYVDYFDDASYQAKLAEEAGLTEPVGLVARAAATSPILVVEATASDAATAARSATAVAEAFRDDINASATAERDALVGALEERLAQARTRDDAAGVATLQEQVAVAQRDTTNELQDLQLDGGVTTDRPSLLLNVGVAAVGGLLAGLAAAVALGSTALARRERLDTPAPTVEDRRSRTGLGLVLLVGGGGALLIGALALVRPGQLGVLLAILGAGLVAAYLGLTNPLTACLFWLVASFFRLVPIPGVPVEPVVAAFGGWILAVVIWNARNRETRLTPGLLELLALLYVLLNVGSMLAPHAYEAGYPADGTSISVYRFILFGTLMPCVALVLSRLCFGRRQTMHTLVFALMGFAAYSALVSILSEWAPALVYPRYIVTEAIWPERAVGVFNQPVVNGLVLVLGFVASVLVASGREEHRTVRVGAALLAPICLYSVYLTHTRAAMAGLAIVLVVGAVLARGWRTGYLVTIAAVGAAVAVNWSTFASSDRASGGVGSSGEILDRLNMAATGAWAVSQEPLFGWGIARFPAVNTFHHKQWSPEVPWDFGWGLSGHADVVGVAAELGLVGVALWLALFGLIGLRLVRAVRILQPGTFERDFAVLSLLAFILLMAIGLAVDLRFFDFPNIVVMLLAGTTLGHVEKTRRSADDLRRLAAPSRITAETRLPATASGRPW